MYNRLRHLNVIPYVQLAKPKFELTAELVKVQLELEPEPIQE